MPVSFVVRCWCPRYGNDTAKAVTYFKRAQVLGNQDAAYNLGGLYSTMNARAKGPPLCSIVVYHTDLSAICFLAWGRFTAHGARHPAGCTNGNTLLQVCKMTPPFDGGRAGIKKNLTAAIESFEVAAAAGHPYAQHELASMYSLGNGASRNISAAVAFAASTSEKSFDVGDVLHDAVSAYINNTDEAETVSALKYMYVKY